MEAKNKQSAVMQKIKPYMMDMNFSLTVAIVIVGIILAFKSPYFSHLKTY